jgi:hypothetical protein
MTNQHPISFDRLCRRQSWRDRDGQQRKPDSSDADRCDLPHQPPVRHRVGWVRFLLPKMSCCPMTNAFQPNPIYHCHKLGERHSLLEGRRLVWLEG